MPETKTLASAAFLGQTLVPFSGAAQEFGARHRNWRKLWSHFVTLCPSRINDVDLMQSILCLALPDNEDNEELAELLIAKHGNFANAISAPLSDHDYFKSFPAVAGVALKVVYAAAERLVEANSTNQPILCDQKSVKEYLHSTLKQQGTEQVRVLFFDRSKRLLADEVFAQGRAPCVRLDPVDVVNRALYWGTTALALVHRSPNSKIPFNRNHLKQSLNIRDLCERLNVHFLDHFTVTLHEISSFKDAGLL